MKNKKRFLSAAAALLLLAAVLLLPVHAGNSSAPAPSDGSLTIVAEIFPAYDWTRELLTGVDRDVNLHLLLDNGVDLHSFQPTVDDIMTIADSDVLIYVGGQTDGWIEDALAESDKPDRQVINLMDVLGEQLKEEEHIEGMKEERGHSHEHEGEDEDEDENLSLEHENEERSLAHEDADEDLDHEEGEEHSLAHEDVDEEHDHEDKNTNHDDLEYDEHVWLSLRNAEILTQAIADALSTIDPENAEAYAANADSYNQQLSALDQDYQDSVDQAAFHTVLFGDRFPFRYLTDDYDLSYYAAFAGCAADSEASFETIAFLASKVDELHLPAVLTMEGTDHRIAETIAANTKQPNLPVLTMDSMQATTKKESEEGVTYLSIMRSNLSVLQQAIQTAGAVLED